MGIYLVLYASLYRGHGILRAKFLYQADEVLPPNFCCRTHGFIKSEALKKENERLACITISDALILCA